MEPKRESYNLSTQCSSSGGSQRWRSFLEIVFEKSRITLSISSSCRVKFLFPFVLSLSYSFFSFLLLFVFHWLGKKTLINLANWFLWPLPIRLILLQIVSQCRWLNSNAPLVSYASVGCCCKHNRQLQGEILKIWWQGCWLAVCNSMTSVECQSVI